MAEPTAGLAALTALADELYAAPAEGFTQARNAAAKEADDKQLAAAVKRLKKPTVPAWAVNLLVRRESAQIDSVLELAESLRAAAEALDGDELRALTRQRRQLTAALAATARSLARDAGVRLTAAVVDQVEGILNAAMLDPVAAQVVRTGRVLTAFTSTGMSELDLAAVVAVPEALDVAARPVAAPPEEDHPPPELRVVVDEGARRAAAEQELEQAAAGVTEAEADLAEVDASIEELNARRLQLQGEADELRRRIAALEDEVDGVDEDLEEAEAARDEAVEAVDAARRTHQAAERALARLPD